ncbi:MAG: hypothetical protein KC478_14755 [Bacteriovoracaceae bacterium]|nr:hypothetical protein [Bacteriovoracaceae bacterium]
MNQTISVGNSMKSYINMAKTGHYPLFFSEWLDGSLKEARPVSYKNAKQNVNEVFDKLAKHKSIERKKTMMESLSTDERSEFIQSFFKMVERDILKDLKSLH